MKILLLISMFLVSLPLLGQTGEQRREEMLYPVGRILLYKNVSEVARPEWEGFGSGSGVAFRYVGDKTQILTAYHVVAQKPDRIMVQFVDDQEVHLARVKKLYEEDDLAVIEVDVKKKYLATLGISPLERAEDVWAVGSGLGAPLAITRGYSGITMNGITFFSANIVSGNSGGAFYSYVDGHFRLYGIVTALLRTPTDSVPMMLPFLAMTEDGPQFMFKPQVVVTLVPVYHQGIAISLQSILDFLGDGSDV